MTSYILTKITDRIFNESDGINNENHYYKLLSNNQLLSSALPAKDIDEQQPEISSNLSTQDHKIIVKISRRSYQLDYLFEIFGFKLGLNAVISLIPIVGVFINFFNSIMIYSLVFKLDHTPSILLHLQLLFNIFIEFVANFVPVLGQVFNAGFKANSRNSILIINHLNQVSDSNFNDLLKYINNKNKNNINNNLFKRSGSTTSSSNSSVNHHYLTTNDDFGIAEDNASQLSYTKVRKRPPQDLQEKLSQHQRKLSNSVYESDSNTSGFFK